MDDGTRPVPEKYTLEGFIQLMCFDGAVHSAFWLAAIGLYCGDWFKGEEVETLAAYVNLDFPTIHRNLLSYASEKTLVKK